MSHLNAALDALAEREKQMKKTEPTMYRIVYVFRDGLRYLLGHGNWWPIRHDDEVASHIQAAAMAGELFDIEVR